MVRAGNIEFSDSSQSLYFRSEETVSQILQVTLFIDGSFIRGGQVDGSFGSLEGNDGVYLFVLQAVRDKPVITFQDIGRLIRDQAAYILKRDLTFSCPPLFSAGIFCSALNWELKEFLCMNGILLVV